MTDVRDTLHRINPVTDTEAARAVRPDTKDDLLAAILATGDLPAAPARTRRPVLRLAVPALAVTGILAAVAVTTVGLPGSDDDAPRALSVTDLGDAVIVRVVDPLADPKRYNKEFKELGLDIKVTMVPVSPPKVGRLAFYDMSLDTDGSKIHTIEAGENCPPTMTSADPECQPGVKVLKSFTGEVTISFGRAARQGETYQYMSSSAGDKGEVLAGVPVRNKTVAEVLPMLAARGLTVQGYLWDSDDPQHPNEGESVPGSWYVHDVGLHSPGVVSIWTGERKATTR
jgi:hypothetical protein